MPSPFDAAMSAADATIAATFGGASPNASIQPRADRPKLGLAADPARAPATVVGVFTLVSGEQTLDGAKLSESSLRGFTHIATATARLWLTAGTAAALGYEIQPMDLVVMTDRPGQPHYSVVHVLPTDHGDVTLLLASEASP